MKVTEIDLCTYPRRDHFEYFRKMGYPYVGTTVNVDITDFIKSIKERKLPFFLSFLYSIAGAANAVPELRRRIKGDGIVEYSACNTSHTVMREDETYCYCTLDYDLPFDDFLPYAKEEQCKAINRGNLKDEADSNSKLFISSSPWTTYTALVQPVPNPADSNPRISWGKYFEQSGRILIPVSILAHHALVDGIHIAKFYLSLEERLKEI